MIKCDHDFFKACYSILHSINTHNLDNGSDVRREWRVIRTRCSKLVFAHQVHLGSFEIGREQFDPAGIARRLSRYPRRKILGVSLTVCVEGFAAPARLTLRK